MIGKVTVDYRDVMGGWWGRKNEFNAYCEFLGSDSKSALKEAIDIQKIKSPEERKSELSGKYKEHQPTRQKLG